MEVMMNCLNLIMKVKQHTWIILMKWGYLKTPHMYSLITVSKTKEVLFHLIGVVNNNTNSSITIEQVDRNTSCTINPTEYQQLAIEVIPVNKLMMMKPVINSVTRAKINFELTDSITNKTSDTKLAKPCLTYSFI